MNHLNGKHIANFEISEGTIDIDYSENDNVNDNIENH